MHPSTSGPSCAPDRFRTSCRPRGHRRDAGSAPRRSARAAFAREHRGTGRVAAVLTLLGAAASAHASVFTDYNLIVRDDVQLSTSEVDGSSLIGGSLLGGASNYAVQGVTAANNDGLALGGTLAAGVTVNINAGGNFRVADPANVFGTVNLNGGGAQLTDPAVPAQAADAVSQAQTISGFLSGLPANGTVDPAGNLNATPAVLDGQNVAIYSITQSQFDSLGQLNLNLGAADTVIINFDAGPGGIADLTAPPNIIGGFNQANSSRILWNFADASQVIVNNSFNGALFAPKAALTVNGGGINGTVVVDSIDLQNAEIRRFTYTGYLPTPGALGLLGVAGLAASRRRRAV